ncbi:MAG: sigma factor-like helix-turn-helix DNA-binding protein [Thermotaleaceae bacterium]
MYEDKATWTDLTMEYKDSLDKIKEVKTRRKHSKNHTDAVDCEIAGSMESDLTQTVRELRKKVLYEYNTITEEDIINPKYSLTERQKEILLLRQQHNSYTKVANIINSDPRIVFKIYNRAIDKLLKKKEQENSLDGLTGLSKRQEEIYDLYFNKHFKPKQIANRLGVSVNTVKGYLQRIKQKTGVKIG